MTDTTLILWQPRNKATNNSPQWTSHVTCKVVCFYCTRHTCSCGFILLYGLWKPRLIIRNDSKQYLMYFVMLPIRCWHCNLQLWSGFSCRVFVFYIYQCLYNAEEHPVINKYCARVNFAVQLITFDSAFDNFYNKSEMEKNHIPIRKLE